MEMLIFLSLAYLAMISLSMRDFKRLTAQDAAKADAAAGDSAS